jgi:hypothetical protein
MARQAPVSLRLIGLGLSFFAAAYLLWFLLYAWPHLQQILGVAFGDAGPITNLMHDNLAGAATVRAAVMLGSARVVLVGGLATAGVGLVLLWRWARWASIFGSAMLIVLALASTVARLWFLTLPGGAVKVTPLLLDGTGILLAIVGGGLMFLPEVTAAYGGLLEQPPSTAPAARS